MEWAFSDKARDSIRDSTARLNLWHGSVRSGKTISSIIRWIMYLREAPPGALLMVGKTERTLKRNILDEIEQIVGSKNYRYVGGSGEAWICGRKVLLVGANDERAEGKIRGLTAAGAYGDELTLWPEGFFRQLLARMSVRDAKLFGTTNPDGPYHWLKAGFLDRTDLDLRQFHFELEDNVALDPEYVRSLKLEYGEGSLWYKRFIDGLWIAAEGAVYDFFNEREHVITQLPDRKPDQVDLSIDYGTSNATSVGAFASWNRTPPGQLKTVRLAGWYYDGRATGRQKTDTEYVGEIKEWVSALDRPIRYVFVDPSAASFQQELQRSGFRVIPADNSVIDGIRTQAKMLRNGEYKLLKGHGNDQAIRDYGAYLWDTKAQARGEDKPLKQNDHCFVAGTMVTTRRGPVPIERVTARDEVLTRAGYRRVLRAGMTRRNAPVMRARFSNGSSLVATPNHPIFIQGRGFTRMDELRYADDAITVWDEQKPARIEAESTARLGTARVLAPPRPCGHADVYDLTVDELPEFVANGILVHNSKDEERYYLHTMFGQPQPGMRRYA